MLDHDPTVRSRELGIALRTAAERSGMNQSDIGEMLDWSPSKISRIISGKRPPSQVDVATMLGGCDVPRDERESLIAIAKEVRTLNWLVEDEDYWAGRAAVLAHLEQEACRLDAVSPFVVPALLQVESYTRAIGPTGIGEAEVKNVHERQRRLEREWGTLHFLFDENALSRSDLPSRAVSDQVHHLLRMSVQPNISIHVVPTRNGGISCEPFEIIDLGEDSIKIVCVELLTGLTFLERPDTVRTYRNLRKELRVVAWTAEQTRSWLIELGEELGSGKRFPSDAPEPPTAIFA
jgi:transcriptional regulator with XRE-family HTH domain